MHEMGIATAIIDSVRQKFGSEPGARIIGIGVRIGELVGVDAASLRFCFNELAASDGLAGAKLSIEHAPRRNYCPACDLTFPVSGFEFGCPSCYSTNTEPAGGHDEVTVSWVDLEESEEAARAATA